MKHIIAATNRKRQKCKKNKEQNALLMQELSVSLKTLVGGLNLFQQILAHRYQINHIDHKRAQEPRPRTRKIPIKRLDRCRHRIPSCTHRSTIDHRVNHSSSINSLKSFVLSDISSIRAVNNSTMNRAFVASNLSDENVARNDSNTWFSPTGSDSELSVYFTANNSPQSIDAESEFRIADFQQNDDDYDADVEMSNVLMHGDKSVNESNVRLATSPLLPQSKSEDEFTNFSFQSPYYVTQQRSDVFTDYGEILCNETNNNHVTQVNKLQAQTSQSANYTVGHFPVQQNSALYLSNEG